MTVKMMQIAKAGIPQGTFRLVLFAPGEKPTGLCRHEHVTTEEAAECEIARNGMHMLGKLSELVTKVQKVTGKRA